MGFPTRRDEEWKYTDVRAIAQGNFALAENSEFSQAQAAALTLPPGCLPADVRGRCVFGSAVGPRYASRQRSGYAALKSADG
ncbi:hypothetical protein HAALTHF_43840n [Vreelandella aquamarina]|nr:hypothetical protein HAALTHF_43840n [Halomonas axialensis]